MSTDPTLVARLQRYATHLTEHGNEADVAGVAALLNETATALGNALHAATVFEIRLNILEEAARPFVTWLSADFTADDPEGLRLDRCDSGYPATLGDLRRLAALFPPPEPAEAGRVR